jgi:hypothetical protein
LPALDGDNPLLEEGAGAASDKPKPDTAAGQPDTGDSEKAAPKKP